MTESPSPGENDAAARARRRFRGFVMHLMAYFVGMLVLVPVNLLTTPQTPWFVLPMVGWGSALAIHVAWVLGLFDSHRR